MEEVIESNLKQCGQRRIRRDVATDSGIFFVLPMTMAIAFQRIRLLIRRSRADRRVGKLFLHRDGIHVRCVELDRHIDAAFASVPYQRVEQVGATRLAFFINDLVEGFNPFRYFGVLFFADFINNFWTGGKFQNRGIMHCHIHLEDKSVYRRERPAENRDWGSG